MICLVIVGVCVCVCVVWQENSSNESIKLTHAQKSPMRHRVSILRILCVCCLPSTLLSNNLWDVCEFQQHCAQFGGHQHYNIIYFIRAAKSLKEPRKANAFNYITGLLLFEDAKWQMRTSTILTVVVPVLILLISLFGPLILHRYLNTW